MGGPAGKKTFPALAIRSLGEHKARQHDPVEKPLEYSRHGAPPGGKHDQRMVRPGDGLHGGPDVIYARLVAGQDVRDIRLEAESSKVATTRIGASALCALGVNIRQYVAKAPAARVCDQEQHPQP